MLLPLLCPRTGGGCFAEYVVAKRRRVTLRGDIPEPEACTIGITGLSAYDCLCNITDIRTRAGQIIFIPGGAGGVGHFAVQLAKAYGLRVIASASRPAGVELLRKLGADVVIDYSKQDVAAEVMKATEGRDADVVYDSTYVESSMKESAAVVAKGGQWVRLGPWFHSSPGFQQELEPIAASRGATVSFGDLAFYATNPDKLPLLVEGHRVMRQLYAEGRLKPYISATVPLDVTQLQQAFENCTQGTVGKVVVKVH